MSTTENPKYWAYLKVSDTLYLKSQTDSVLQTPFTPVTELIDYVYATYPENALSLLRNPFITNYELPPICKETLKVCAKRVCIDPLFQPEREIQLVSNHKTISTEFLRFIGQAYTLQDSLNLLKNLSQTSRNEEGFPIYSLALSQENIILAFQKNLNFKSKTHHAETLVCREYYLKHRKPLPKGTRIVTTLQPCRMCAAHILELSEEPKVYFLEKDTGPYSKNTLVSHIEFQLKD